MTVHALPPRDRAGRALVEVRRATHALQRELGLELAKASHRRPELVVWISTALTMLELTVEDLVTERDRRRRRAGVAVAQMHAMRVSSGLEVASVMGALEVEPEAFDDLLGTILGMLERARG